MASFYFHTDPGLTSPLAGSLDFAQAVDGSTGAQVITLYFGSSAAGRMLRAASNPGADQIRLSIADATPSAGSPATDVTLSLDATFVGRTAGDALSLGVVVNSGAANAIPVYVRVHDSTRVLGVNTDLSLVMNLCEES